MEQGIDALTMPALARELDAAVGGIYRYFDGKQALLVALQSRAIRVYSERLDQALEAAQTPRDEVLAAWTAWRRFAVEQPELHGLIDAGLSDPRQLLDDDDAHAVQQALDPVLERVAASIQAAQDAGTLSAGDARLRAYALWAALHGVDHFRKRDPRLPAAFHSDRVAEVLVDSIVGGWAPVPADGEKNTE